jgi:hypothetical protein
VVDEGRRPLGVVKSNGVLAALASLERRHEAGPPAVAATDRRFSLRRSDRPAGRV